MRIKDAIIHECNPGQSPGGILAHLQGVPIERIGLEVDVTLKYDRRSIVEESALNTERGYSPVAISRDRRFRVPILEHLSSFRSGGFEGPVSLDCIDRRATNSILALLASELHRGLVGEVFFQVPEIALMYKTPWAAKSGQFHVEPQWQALWDRITVNTRFPTLIHEFIDYGQPVNLFWEPVDDQRYRTQLHELIKNRNVQSILYKMPCMTRSAAFDPVQCLQRDLDLMNSVPNEMLVIPIGTAEVLCREGGRLFGRSKAETPPVDSSTNHTR